jgi:hypothetical protein
MGAAVVVEEEGEALAPVDADASVLSTACGSAGEGSTGGGVRSTGATEGSAGGGVSSGGPSA